MRPVLVEDVAPVLGEEPAVAVDLLDRVEGERDSREEADERGPEGAEPRDAPADLFFAGDA